MRIIINADGPTEATILPTARHVNVVEGSTFGPYFCTADCKPKCSIYWFVNVTDRYRTLTPYVTGNNISINKVERRHSGTYICKANVTINGKELLQSSDFALNVLC